MNPTPTCLVWRHKAHEGPGVFGDLLAARGWQVRIVDVAQPADVTPEAETADLLDETQQAAFQEFQEQMKDMQLMGLKMAEKMMSKEKDDSTE